MVEPRVILFCGGDELQKQRRIEDLQKKFFPPDIKDLNYTLLHGDDKDLTPKKIQEVLSYGPTGGAAKRLLVIRAADRMNQATERALMERLTGSDLATVAVLDVATKENLEGLKEALRDAHPRVEWFLTASAPNVFDLGRAVLGRRPDAALKILCGLLEGRERSEKILGGIFWQWENFYSTRKISVEAYRKGLKMILAADKRLKSSSSAFARAQLVLEALVVKLSYVSR